MENKEKTFKTYIWNTSPACKSTFQEIVNEINVLHDKINALENKLRWKSPDIKPKLMDKNSMFSVNVSILVEEGYYEYSGYYNFHTKKWLIYPNEEPFEFELISGWRSFL